MVTKRKRFIEATTDTFAVPDGDLTKEKMRDIGVFGTINRGVPTRYFAKDGKVYSERTVTKKWGRMVELLVFTYGPALWSSTGVVSAHWECTEYVTYYNDGRPPQNMCPKG